MEEKMKSKFWLLVITPVILFFGFSYVYAACTSVATTDFHGQVCSDPGRETRTGIWVNEDGGTFSGTAVIYTNSDNSQSLTKQGKLISSTFDGTLQYDESKDIAGKVASREIKTGKWRNSRIIILKGTITTYCNPDGTYSIVDGRI
jgi:hypothetical protein